MEFLFELFTILILTATQVRCEVSERFIVQVNSNCSDNRIDDAYIEVIADYTIEAKATCVDSYQHPFTTEDDVHHILAVSYPGQGTSPCVFHKRQDADVYVVKVVISQGESGRLVHEIQEEYSVSCSYSARGVNATTIHEVPEGYLAPLETQRNVGEEANTTLELQLSDVLGGDLTGTTLDVGKTVWLRATTSGEAGEVGMKPVSCHAIGVTVNRSYPILRAGCGDGQVFRKDQGFFTQGFNVTSPYFKSFNVESDPVLKFTCNFTMCSTNCDGSSCLNEQRKRRAVNMGEFVMEESIPLHIVQTNNWPLKRAKTWRSPIEKKLDAILAARRKQRKRK